MNKSISKTIYLHIALNSFIHTFYLRITVHKFFIYYKTSFQSLRCCIQYDWVAILLAWKYFAKPLNQNPIFIGKRVANFPIMLRSLIFYTTYWSNRPASAYARKPHINTNKISVTRKIKSRRIAIIMIVTTIGI